VALQSARSASLRDALRAAAARLRSATVDTPDLDARVLLQHLLQFERTDLLLHLDDPLSPERAGALRRLLARRMAGEPIAYLTGRREFYGLDLQVTPDVLIPRPETEVLVERAIVGLPAGITAVDIGTGSGAIAVALARHRPDLRLLAIDRSPQACRVARSNVCAQDVQPTVGVVCADLLSAVRRPVEGILANLPYLRHDELPELAREVRKEPQQALDGGQDGLDLYRRLLTDLAARRPPPLLVLCEIAPPQADTMRGLVSTALPECEVRVLPDLAGRARVVEARRAL
jgi:release factor glutamine methyltransferase